MEHASVREDKVTPALGWLQHKGGIWKVPPGELIRLRAEPDSFDITHDSGRAAPVPGAGFDPRPWVKIAREILAGIDDGTYAPGDRLPALASMADRHQVSQGTVCKAYAYLRRQGVADANHNVTGFPG